MPRRLTPARAVPALLAAVAAVGLLVPACGDDGPDLAQQRADQLRDAARRAGLPDEVADVLALAARGGTTTYQVGYPGEQGARIVVSQDPPERRFDVLQGDRIVESRVLHRGVAYRCEPDTGKGAATGALTCTRAAGAIDAPGTFTDESLTRFVDQVAASKDTLSMIVDRRTIAGARARCLTTTPKPGTPLDGTGPGTDVLCLSAEGAQLLVDHDGQRLVADHYETSVPRGTFDTDRQER
jgi:hypothetical protein